MLVLFFAACLTHLGESASYFSVSANLSTDKAAGSAAAARRDPDDIHPIDHMRAELCFKRFVLLKHDDCMRWLVRKCMGKYKGAEMCDKLRALLKERCIKGNEEACDFAIKLGMDPSGWQRHGRSEAMDAEGNGSGDDIVEDDDGDGGRDGEHSGRGYGAGADGAGAGAHGGAAGSRGDARARGARGGSAAGGDGGRGGGGGAGAGGRGGAGGGAGAGAGGHGGAGVGDSAAGGGKGGSGASDGAGPGAGGGAGGGAGRGGRGGHGRGGHDDGEESSALSGGAGAMFFTVAAIMALAQA